MITYGIEEEVFITEPERPTMRSMYFLAKLLAKNPKFYYTHSASNFSRGKDLKQGLMSGVEISTKICKSVDDLIEDFGKRRQDLCSVSKGLIVPVGHLLNFDAPTNTCSMQFHVGGLADKKKAYNNLLHFLPILPLFTINSPMKSCKYFGKSYRIHDSFAVGAIGDDWTVRFQDLILSKRLGTIELRVCDPCWDLNRVKYLAKAIEAIVKIEDNLNPDIEGYNNQRKKMSLFGLLDENTDLVTELKSIVDFPEELLVKTASDELHEMFKSDGLIAAYSACDNGYRNGVFEPREITEKQKAHIAKGIIGFAGYYIPRLPYYAWKGLVE